MFDYATIYWTLADNAYWIIPAGVGASVVSALGAKPVPPCLPPPPPGAVYGACAAPPPLHGFDAQEQAKVERAWALAEGVPNAHLLAAVRNVRKSDSKRNSGASAFGGEVTINQSINDSDRGLAACLIHEATHCDRKHTASTPRTEREAFREENVARRALWISTVSETFDRHRAMGYRDDGTLGGSPPIKSEPKPQQKQDGPWKGWESFDDYRRRMKQEKLAQSEKPAEEYDRRAHAMDRERQQHQERADVPWKGWQSYDDWRAQKYAEKLKKWGLA